MNFAYKHTKYASYIGYMTQAIVNNLAPLLFVSFQRDFALSLDRISVLITLNFGVQILVDFLAAKYIDKIGYRMSTVLAHIAAFAGIFGMGILPYIMPPFAGLAISVAVCAVGGGLIETVISPIVEALPGKEKESAMSMLHSFYCWGQVAVVLLSTLFFNVFGVKNWHYLPALWSLIPFFNIFLFAKVPIRPLVEDGTSTPLARLFSVRIFRLLLLLMLSAGAAELAMSQWASMFAEKGLNVSKTLGDLLGPCAFALLMGITRTIYGFFGSKIPLKPAMLTSGVLCIISYITAVFAPNPLLALCGCALCGLSVGILWPGTIILAAKYYPQGGTSMFAMLALVGDIGCSLGPTLSGFVANAAGDLKTGILCSIIFPVILTLGISTLKPK